MYLLFKELYISAYDFYFLEVRFFSHQRLMLLIYKQEFMQERGELCHFIIQLTFL